MPAESSLIHDLPAVTIRRIAVSDMSNNVYLLTAKKSGVQVLIDAADDAPAIRELMGRAVGDTPCSPGVKAVLTTHQHWDHIRALPEFDVAGVELLAGERDAGEIEAQQGVAVDRLLTHGETVTYDGVTLEVIHLRGHTPGSLAFALNVEDGPTHLFTGDSLFPGGVGKTWSDEDFVQLIDDVEARLFAVYEDDSVVHPGHGDPTTLGTERPHLSEWRRRGW
ncbi:MBL fold metallo-hydrolase [Nesterenkonia sp. NBAIMH1]|uniref:MBL fold metallo-hydrolase n=1 Tax=Nesterenkonia sp. NBAIMH1 TaxID=2600320 RepID=UPI0011B83125|nr:MBL fold metallo-hydrolase [Nesterenkonia sp. NBAIMH1]